MAWVDPEEEEGLHDGDIPGISDMRAHIPDNAAGELIESLAGRGVSYGVLVIEPEVASPKAVPVVMVIQSIQQMRDALDTSALHHCERGSGRVHGFIVFMTHGPPTWIERAFDPQNASCSWKVKQVPSAGSIIKYMNYHGRPMAQRDVDRELHRLGLFSDKLPPNNPDDHPGLRNLPKSPGQTSAEHHPSVWDDDEEDGKCPF